MICLESIDYCDDAELLRWERDECDVTERTFSCLGLDKEELILAISALSSSKTAEVFLACNYNC
jgi:hypothetical protein